MLGADLKVWAWALVLLGGIALVFLILHRGRRRTGRLMPEALFAVSADADQVHVVDPDVEELWAEDAERRWREIESGAVATIPWEEVRPKLFPRG